MGLLIRKHEYFEELQTQEKINRWPYARSQEKASFRNGPLAYHDQIGRQEGHHGVAAVLTTSTVLSALITAPFHGALRRSPARLVFSMLSTTRPTMSLSVLRPLSRTVSCASMPVLSVNGTCGTTTLNSTRRRWKKLKRLALPRRSPPT